MIVLFLGLLLSIQGILLAEEEEQPGESPDRRAGNVIEEVVVTGSRLIRSNMDSPSPVITFDAEQLKESGVTSLGEFSRFLPQNADNFSEAASTNSPLQGGTAFNLRGIGFDGTLTLVNGRRIAPLGASAKFAPFVDIDAIPMASIERIEVLTDGASAIYGSEAVAGVVNIITRKHVEGITIEGGYTSTREGDGNQWDIAVSGGWSNVATRMSGSLSYFERDVIWSRDREFAKDLDLSNRGGADGRSPRSSPPSIYRLETGDWVADPECPEHTDVNSRAVYPSFGEFCLFNWAAFSTLFNPTNRTGLSAALEHDFNGGTMLFAELLSNRTEIDSVLAPSPPGNMFVPADHPNNPFGEDLIIYSRILDTGSRGFTNKSTSWRALAGLKGTVFDGWNWEAALMGSENESDQIRRNGVLAEALQNALLGFGGASGDQYYNPFGLNPNNPPDVIEQMVLSGTKFVDASQEQTLDLQLAGDLWMLGGGSVGAAFGLQARHQEIRQSADDEELQGVFIGGGGTAPINAERDIWSAFAEFFLPLHETFEAQLAVRYDNYSDFGSTTNPKIGLGWRPVEELLLRATWGTSYRPPLFRELFEPVFTYNGVIFRDPHRCPATGDPIDCLRNEVESSTAGNPDLHPDEGETYLFGFVWQPSFAEGLELALEIWQIEHRDRILPTNDPVLQEILIERLDPFDNPFISRAPQSAEDIALGIPGVITGVNHSYINGDKLETNGIDFNIDWVFQLETKGAFSTRLNYSYLDSYEFGLDLLGVQYSDQFAGAYGFNGALPKHRANLQISWSRASHGMSALLKYAGDYRSYTNLHIDGAETETPFVVDDYLQLDLQYNHVFENFRGAMVRVGCINCTDEDPPTYNYSQPLVEGFHEGRGLMWYLRWIQPFR